MRGKAPVPLLAPHHSSNFSPSAGRGRQSRSQEPTRCNPLAINEFGGMAVYYFHLRDGDALIPDETGMDLPNLNEARREALQAARDMLADQLRAGEALDGQRIEITAPNGEVLDVISFREALLPGGAIH